MAQHIKLAILAFILGCSVIEGYQHHIDITSYNPSDKSTQTFHRLINLSNATEDGIVVRSNSTSFNGFYILQAHSHRFNISLAGNNKKVEGHNIGLKENFQGSFEHVFSVGKIIDESSLVIFDSTILIAVAVYDDKAPIPGGCDTNNDTHPILDVFNGADTITLKAITPTLSDHNCNISDADLRIEIYHKYLSSQDFTTNEYYQGIISMLSIEQVEKNGKLAATLNGLSNIEKFFSSYIGTGEVFAILVYKNDVASAYVPAVSYGADINYLIDKQDRGVGADDVFVVLFSILPFVSLIIIYWGHILFHFTTFSLGLSCGTILSFFLLSTEGATTVDHTFFLSLLFGILYGAAWLGIWYKLGVPLLSATLAFLHAGALLTSMIYHFGVADDINFQNNAIYWTIFCGIVFMCWFSLSLFTMHGHILSCCFLGSYILMITTLNYWLGGNLQYIMINVYRRMFVSDFNLAVLQPPFQAIDHVIGLIGLLFLVHGYHRQVKLQRGRPPFPPHQSFRPTGERSPLLGQF